MGWGSGVVLAEKVWGFVCRYIPEEKRAKVAKQIIEAFRNEDWDTVDEAETLASAAGWYNEEEYDALCIDDPEEDPEESPDDESLTPKSASAD